MPKGKDTYGKFADRQKARSAQSSNSSRVEEFKLLSGERARLRFLEQGDDITWAASHRIIPPWSKFATDIICLDQKDEGTPCPACSSDDQNIRRRSTKGYFNVIWRGNDDLSEANEKIVASGQTPYKLAPVYKLSEKGYPEKGPDGQKLVTGFEDKIVLWKCSKTVFEELLEKDSAYKGLMSRDFQIARKGASKDDTKYFIEPAVVDGGPESMVVADMQLMTTKYDLDVVTTPPSYEEMADMLRGNQEQEQDYTGPNQQEANQGDGVFNNPAVRSSAFQK